MTGTLVLFRYTTLGLRMRATAFSREIARLLGVRVGILLSLGWGLAGIAGSLAGLLVAPTSSFGPYYMDLDPHLRLHGRRDRWPREPGRRHWWVG